MATSLQRRRSRDLTELLVAWGRGDRAALDRVLNALENIRSSIEVAARGRTMAGAADMNDLARLSLAESVDALDVLSTGAFANHEEPGLKSARIELRAAGVAVTHLRKARSALANPATLPPSFRN